MLGLAKHIQSQAHLWLTSWEEDSFGNKIRRSWKGYNFDILDKLREEGDDQRFL